MIEIHKIDSFSAIFNAWTLLIFIDDIILSILRWLLLSLRCWYYILHHASVGLESHSHLIVCERILHDFPHLTHFSALLQPSGDLWLVRSVRTQAFGNQCSLLVCILLWGLWGFLNCWCGVQPLCREDRLASTGCCSCFALFDELLLTDGWGGLSAELLGTDWRACTAIRAKRDDNGHITVSYLQVTLSDPFDLLRLRLLSLLIRLNLEFLNAEWDRCWGLGCNNLNRPELLQSILCLREDTTARIDRRAVRCGYSGPCKISNSFNWGFLTSRCRSCVAFD